MPFSQATKRRMFERCLRYCCLCLTPCGTKIEATHNDLLRILDWLRQEYDDTGDSFFCNRHLLEEGQQDGSLTALIRNSDELPVAFCLGEGISILAVKADFRGQGFGRYLAQYFIDAARNQDVIGLYGECAPPTSKGFWENLEFHSVPSPLSDGNRNWVACPLPHEHTLPNGTREKISITLEHAELPGHSEFQCDAVQANGRYILATDFVHYVPRGDQRLEIRCDDRVIFAKKSKYVSEVGGEFVWPWVRVRELVLDDSC